MPKKTKSNSKIYKESNSQRKERLRLIKSTSEKVIKSKKLYSRKIKNK